VKSPFVAALVLFAALASAAAQATTAQGLPGPVGGDIRWSVRQLNLSPAEIKSIEDIANRQADGLAAAASEMRIIQAKLERLLLDKDPDMDAIRQLVKSSLDWELQIRMARIERAIDLRKLLGPERWAILQRLQRDYLLVKKTGRLRPGELGDNGSALAALLDRLE